jgi:arylsulfatase A-like enzyme
MNMILIPRTCVNSLILALALLAAVGLPQTHAASKKHPNVVLILADDLGWSDLSCHGGNTPTPHIDRFINKGVELGNFMVTPLCSPTRAALMTGRYPARLGLAPFVINPKVTVNLPREEVTLGEAFQSAGYATACIGKWHLGETISPNQQGFHYYQGNLSGGVDYFTQDHMGHGEHDWFENGKPYKAKGYTTDIIADKAVQYIKDSGPKPFFLYLPFTAVHTPIQASQKYLRQVPEYITNQPQRTYSAMIIALDQAVFKILKAIEHKTIVEDTIVVFTSDNGATPTGCNLPFRGGKHTVYQGGVHVPAAISWPGHIKGLRLVNSLITIQDLYPTLLKLAGVKRPPGPPLDSHDVSRAILNDEPTTREAYYWTWFFCDAIRTKEWKLLRYWNRLELYDMKNDIGESKNLADKKPETAGRLVKELDKWHKAINCYPSHVPMKFDKPIKPRPSGDVLEIRVKRNAVEEDSFMWLSFFASASIHLSAGDWIEYDMLIPQGAATKGYLIDETLDPKDPRPFWRVDAVDQYGNFQDYAVGFPQAHGQWAHRTIGLGNNAPFKFGHVRVAFNGKEKADYLIYLDNVLFHRGDGSTIELYRNGEPKRKEIWKTDAYPVVNLKSVPLANVEKKLVK